MRKWYQSTHSKVFAYLKEADGDADGDKVVLANSTGIIAVVSRARLKKYWSEVCYETPGKSAGARRDSA